MTTSGQRRDAAQRFAAPEEARAVDVPRRAIAPRPTRGRYSCSTSLGRPGATGAGAWRRCRLECWSFRPPKSRSRAAPTGVHSSGAQEIPRSGRRIRRTADRGQTTKLRLRDGIRIEPAPERRAADGGDESARQHFAAEISQRPPVQRDARVRHEIRLALPSRMR
jgi:hypothetical protein